MQIYSQNINNIEVICDPQKRGVQYLEIGGLGVFGAKNREGVVNHPRWVPPTQCLMLIALRVTADTPCPAVFACSTNVLASVVLELAVPLAPLTILLTAPHVTAGTTCLEINANVRR